MPFLCSVSETLKIAYCKTKEGLCLVNAIHITASVFINDNESRLHVSVSILHIHIDIHHSPNFDYKRYERQLYDLIDGLYLDKSSGRCETIIRPLGLTYSDIQRSCIAHRICYVSWGLIIHVENALVD